MLTNVVTEEKILSAKAHGYTNVSVWVAATGIASGEVAFNQVGNANCAANLLYTWDSTFKFTSENCNTWIKVTVSIDEYLNTLGDIGVRENGSAAEGGYIKKSYSNLMSLNSSNFTGVAASVFFYVGDIFFE